MKEIDIGSIGHVPTALPMDDDYGMEDPGYYPGGPYGGNPGYFAGNPKPGFMPPALGGNPGFNPAYGGMNPSFGIRPAYNPKPAPVI
jgi:hypothetical protein